jgi:hypothetical protein
LAARPPAGAILGACPAQFQWGIHRTRIETMKNEGDRPARIAGLELNALRASGAIGPAYDG